MRTGYASLAVVGIAACVAVYSLNYQAKSATLYTSLSSEELEFLKFVSKFGRNYGTKEEFKMRSQQFARTLAKISEENSKSENTFRVGINKFADWSPEEFRRILSYEPMHKSVRSTT